MPEEILVKWPKPIHCSKFHHTFCIGVIPCQINKEFRVTSRILTKLGMSVAPVVLITHANF